MTELNGGTPQPEDDDLDAYHAEQMKDPNYANAYFLCEEIARLKHLLTDVLDEASGHLPVTATTLGRIREALNG